MAITPIAPLLFVQQMGPAGKLVNELSTQPEMAQKTFRQVAEKVFRQQGLQIQGISAKEGAIAISEEDSSNSKKKFAKMFKGRQGTKPPEDDEDDEELLSYQEEPYLGNLVNRKV